MSAFPASMAGTAADDAAAQALLHGLGPAGTAAAVLAHPVPRPVLAPAQLLLPDAPAWRDAALRRAAVAHAAAHLRYSAPAQPAGGRKPLALAVLSTVEDARVEGLLAQALPGVRGWFAPCLCRLREPHGLSLAALLARLARVLADPRWDDPHPWVDKGARLFWSVADLHDAAAFRGLALVLANDLGQMRVPFDPQADTVAAPYRDDHAYLWDHGRTRPGPPLPQAAPAAAPAAAAGVPRAHRYAEWDARLGRARPDWCTVLDHGTAAPSGGAASAAPAAARRGLRARPLHGRPRTDGEDIDLAAAVAGWIDHRRGQPCEPRWYQRRPRAPRPASLLLLLDLSHSTRDALPGGGTVLDAGKRAALALASRLHAHGVRVAVHGFHSDTRAAVHYERLLDFGAAPDARAAHALGAARARGSTRLGAALRHAAALLQAEPGPRRAVLLLSDGAPSDIDVFDPQHLVQDARAAVRELAAQGVRAGCGALGAAASSRLRTIFGAAPCPAAGPAAAERLAAFCEGTLIA